MLSKEIAAILPLLIIVHEIYFFDLYTRFKARQKQYSIIFLINLRVVDCRNIIFYGTTFLAREFLEDMLLEILAF